MKLHCIVNEMAVKIFVMANGGKLQRLIYV